MRRSLRKGVLAAAVFLPALGSVAAQDQQGQDQRGQEHQRIEGVWDVSVTVVSCSTGAPTSTIPHIAFLMFADGGTVTEISEGSNRSAGVGTWRHLSGSTYTNREVYYGYSAFGPGTANGTTVITREIELGKNANEYTSYATSDFYDTNGNLTNTVCATATATRFE